MTRSSLAVLAFVAVPLALVCSLSLRADPPQTAGQSDSPFTGKIVVVTQRSNSSVGATLEDVHLRRIGDQTFIVGKGFAADEGKGWYNDRTVWVSLGDVSQVTEFEDRSDLLKARDNRRTSGQ
jgi:hypothetical protein